MYFVLCAAASFLLLLATYIIYELYINPLSKVPGPKLLALTQLPWFIHNFRGNLPFWLFDLHEQYGPAVRIGPHEVSFLATSLQTWKTIRGKRPEMPKSEGGTGLLSPDLGAEVRSTGASYLIVSSTEVHRRMRGALEPAFRDSALREQEGLLKRHVDKIVLKLHEACAQSKTAIAEVDMEMYFSLFTFDVAGDLLFGKDFAALDNLRHDPWYATFFDTIQAMSFGQVATYYRLAGILTKFTPKRLADSAKLFWETSEKMVDQRLDQGRADGKKDWVSYFEMQSLKDKQSLEGVSRQELHKNAGLLLVTGSDTSGAALSGLLFQLCANRHVYSKLAAEVRGRFGSAEQIGINSVGDCEYLEYCIQESLRLYPPGPATIPHQVNQEGESIEGYHVPVGVSLESDIHRNCPTNTHPDRRRHTSLLHLPQPSKLSQPYILHARTLVPTRQATT